MTRAPTLLTDAAGLLQEEKSPPAGGRLIVFRTGGVADAVVALPCLHAVTRAFPEAHRILLTDSPPGSAADSVQGVLEGSGLIDETVCYPPPTAQVWSPLTVLSTLRQLASFALVCLAEQPAALSFYRDLLVFKAAGIPRILGAPWNAADGQCRTDPKTGELEHEAERLARVLGADIPVDLSSASWDLRLSGSERDDASLRLSTLPSGVLPVAVAPDARARATDWGEERWATLIGLLHLRLTRVGLVLTGGPKGRERAARLAALWPGPLVNLCGELSPRIEAAVLERCGLLVCHEGDAMHLAASRGITCIPLLGSLDRPRQWHPYGAQHIVIHAPQGMREIGVERVADAVVAAVDRLRAPAPASGPSIPARALSGTP
jgi:ADP-heptose:LPS heptosyltransferase